jgi:hypothetical protein
MAKVIVFCSYSYKSNFFNKNVTFISKTHIWNTIIDWGGKYEINEYRRKK